VFGDALRDGVQAARAQGKRLDRVYAAPTVAAVIDAKVKRRFELVKAAIASAERRYAELRAWQHAQIERAMKRCPSPLALEVMPGIASDVPCAARECSGPVAVIAIGGGRVCPANAAANGVVVVADGQACYGDERCACVAAPVLPGAVLGP
jgi:hypothetical protein